MSWALKFILWLLVKTRAKLSKKEVIFGMDLHGVLTENVDQRKEELASLRRCGVKIYVITGPPWVEACQELYQLGYYDDTHYDKIISVVDWLKDAGVEMWKDDKGTWWSSEEEWWSSKAKICDELGVLMMIDDSQKYEKYFDDIDTKFILFGGKK